MNNSNDVFDPSLTENYFQQLADKANVKWTEKIENWQLFYLLNQSTNNPQILPYAFNLIVQNLQKVKKRYSPYFIKDYHRESLGLLKLPIIPPVPQTLVSEQSFDYLLKQSAVIQLSQPCWLKPIPQTFCSQSPLALDIMSLYKRLTRVGQENVKLVDLYSSLLNERGIRKPDLSLYSFNKQQETIAEIIEFASIQHAFCLFPRVFFAEILGFTLACCSMPCLFEICFPNHQLMADYFKQRNKFETQIEPIKQCISNYLALFSEKNINIWQRIQQGYFLYYQQILKCRNQQELVLGTTKTASLKVVELIQKNAQAAMGHHQKIQLAGQSLDSWFAGLPENTNEFIEALKQSKYIDRETPENSLILKLFDFNGPMFGVLEKTELADLSHWLKANLNEKPELNSVETEKSKAVNLTLKKQFSENNYAKLNNRELYYYLINVDLYPDVLAIVEHKVHRLLYACCLFKRLPFKQYSHQQFEDFISNLYQKEISIYKPLQGKPTISKAAYLWGLEQIAPMILIDGCWLQKSLELQQSFPEVSNILFSIYGDELGNSNLEQNHPFIFQQLLDTLSINVPSVYKKEFVEHGGFIDSAFDLPVFMLSMSNYSVEFLPELLGLNMAIELSGLGNQYLRLVDDWNYWGINPTIASIHISIDNVASGHTFLAKQAIQNYLDGILSKTAAPEIVDQHWRRIFTGYSSLQFVAGRFKVAMPLGYFLNKLKLKSGLSNA